MGGPKSGRTKKIEGGKVFTFLLAPEHSVVLDVLKAKHGLESRSEALRAVLSMAADAYEVT